MAIHHELDLTGRMSAQGQAAENVFFDLAASKGYRVQLADRYQETREHWDCRLTKDGSPSLTVEIKSQKSFSIFHNGKRTKDFFLVEFVGVAGHAGWLYGKANLVAFEVENGFYLVPRKTLVEIAEAKCSPQFVDRRENMLYKTYGRRDRQDEVSAILINDVISTRNFSFWKK